MEVQAVAEKALSQAKKLGSEKTLVSVSSTEAKEFNIEANKLTLLRTTFDQNLSFKTLVDNRQSTISGNQFSEEAIDRSVKTSLQATKASQQDEGNGFAPSQGHKNFSYGLEPIDEAWMHSRLMELLQARSEKFPDLIIEGSTIKYVKANKTLATSEGTFLTSQEGSYEGFVMFTTKKGKQTSSFNFTGFNIHANQAGQPISLMQISDLETLFKQSTEQLETKKVPAKFEGDVIVTPHCLEGLIGNWSEFLSSGIMLKKSSFFENKLGEKVGSPLWTLKAQPSQSDFASKNFWTNDGYISQNEVIFENGFLKTYLLNHYASKKLNQKVSLSEGKYLKMEPGNKKLQDMIATVKKGVLMCRFSNGRPAENGDISGVAKNSYYIEDGQIKFPIGETMLAANLSKMLLDIQDISQETVKTGYWELPWVRFSGVSVS